MALDDLEIVDALVDMLQRDNVRPAGVVEGPNRAHPTRVYRSNRRNQPAPMRDLLLEALCPRVEAELERRRKA